MSTCTYCQYTATHVIVSDDEGTETEILVCPDDAVIAEDAGYEVYEF